MSTPAASFRFTDDTKKKLLEISKHDKRSQIGELEYLIGQRHAEIKKEAKKE